MQSNTKLFDAIFSALERVENATVIEIPEIIQQYMPDVPCECGAGSVKPSAFNPFSGAWYAEEHDCDLHE